MSIKHEIHILKGCGGWVYTLDRDPTLPPTKPIKQTQSHFWAQAVKHEILEEMKYWTFYEEKDILDPPSFEKRHWTMFIDSINWGEVGTLTTIFSTVFKYSLISYSSIFWHYCYHVMFNCSIINDQCSILQWLEVTNPKKHTMYMKCLPRKSP